MNAPAMEHVVRQLPAPVGKVLSLLPVRPGSVLFATGLNLTLARLLPAYVLSAIAGKKVRIAVTDAGVRFTFMWTGRRFAAAAEQDASDLAISATSHDFWLLAARRADPDTLFFSRRLVMEGDTELGLLVKNALDAIDGPIVDLEAPRRMLAQQLEQLKRGSHSR